MFNGLSKCDYVPKGKKSGQESKKQKSSQFEVGCKEWESKQVSAYTVFFDKKQKDPSNFKQEVPNSHHFTLGDKALSLPVDDHYKTVARKNYPKYENPERSKPVLATKELTATHYTLGEDKLNYQTTNKEHHSPKNDKKVPDVQWKQDRVRYDIITNSNIEKQQLQKACCFDYYNPNSNKGYKSKNYSTIQTGADIIDPITGRKFKQ